MPVPRCLAATRGSSAALGSCPPSRSPWGSAELGGSRGHSTSTELLSKGRGRSALGSQPWCCRWELGIGPNTQALSVIKKKSLKVSINLWWTTHTTEKSIGLVSIAIFTGPLFVQKLGRPPPISRFLLVNCQLSSHRAATALHLSGLKICTSALPPVWLVSLKPRVAYDPVRVSLAGRVGRWDVHRTQHGWSSSLSSVTSAFGCTQGGKTLHVRRLVKGNVAMCTDTGNCF